jgi:hypothetical protein
MQSGGIISVIVFCSILIAGCIELPASDRYIIFYENQTFFSTKFFLNSGETTDSGTWTKKEPGLYSTQSFKGQITDWVYDSFDDSIYMSGFHQMDYHRFKG